ncbi:nitrate/nitrite transporter NrtS [Vibrio caribbeanicus]|jgi:methyl-accepting chemotaxis protein|uniref:nitrate/nitrite transporter NrtS n=1 Tax=Vibrio caribbeanicus TaxID=701175 RepID=UPI0002EDB792|nr:nitrate/nitrite transporter NrtS [Vibrio caribbeanicus]
MTFRLIRRAFFIALVVGSILNVINQYDAFFGEEVIRPIQAALTYCVPFCVSLFSAWLASKDSHTQ